jgi:hypothetical protein
MIFIDQKYLNGLGILEIINCSVIIVINQSKLRNDYPTQQTNRLICDGLAPPALQKEFL